MNRYRSVVTTALAIAGVACATVALVASPVSAISLFAVVGLIAGPVGSILATQESAEPPPLADRFWTGCRYGAAGGIYVLALVGLDKIAPIWVVAAVLMATLALIVVSIVRTRSEAAGSSGVPAADRTTPPDVSYLAEDERRAHHASTQAHAMSTLELCEAWPASYTELERCADPAARARVATRRQIYLDELERRDPVAVRAWLGSDARAASNPAAFLSRQKDETDR